jgi:hypothetical protein
MICHKADFTFVRGEPSRKFFHFARNKILYGIVAGPVKHAGIGVVACLLWADGQMENQAEVNYLILGIVGTVIGGYLTVGILFSLGHTWPMLIVSVPILAVGLFLIYRPIKRKTRMAKSK